MCIGCREFVEACPFGAMQYEENKEIAVKCDLCVDRLAEDKLPACISLSHGMHSFWGEEKHSCGF